MNYQRNRLFTPGPTPVPEFIARRMSEPIIHHRKNEFKQIFQSVRDGLRYVFGTKEEVIVLSSSGTGGMEAAVASLLSPGDKAITVDGGKFGARWADLCHTFGATPVLITKEWGKAVQPEEIVSELKLNPDAKAVYVTYSETSTGVAIDLPAISKAVHENSDALLVVDCISALIALPLKMDEWQLDVVVSASQKGFMVPPGLALVALSERAQAAMNKAAAPTFYLSLKKAVQSLENNATPFTPASTLIIGLNEAIQFFRAKTMEKVWHEHQIFARAIRSGVKKLGLSILAEQPSDALTAVVVPDGWDNKQIIQKLQNDFGIIVAGGQGQIKDKIFRIGHIGYYDAQDIIGFMAALEWTLAGLGWQFESGAGLLAAHQELNALFEV